MIQIMKICGGNDLDCEKCGSNYLDNENMW